MAKELKYYLKSSKTGQAIRTDDKKHPMFWGFFRKNQKEFQEKYDKIKKENGFYGLIFHSKLPKAKFDKENWERFLKETGLKGDEIDFCVDGTNATFLILKLDEK